MRGVWMPGEKDEIFPGKCCCCKNIRAQPGLKAGKAEKLGWAGAGQGQQSFTVTPLALADSLSRWTPGLPSPGGPDWGHVGGPKGAYHSEAPHYLRRCRPVRTWAITRRIGYFYPLPHCVNVRLVAWLGNPGKGRRSPPAWIFRRRPVYSDYRLKDFGPDELTPGPYVFNLSDGGTSKKLGLYEKKPGASPLDQPISL